MRILPTFGRRLREEFGFAVRKIPLSAPAFTCPNIDGAIGRGGCSYCANESFSPNLDRSSRAVLEDQIASVLRQYRASETALRAIGFRRFLAYFQSYSNTYAPALRLRALHDAVLRQKSCVGISVGTRADCVGAEIMEYLTELNRRAYLWVEIGVQSSHDSTLAAINRCEKFGAIAETIAELKRREIRVCAHLIFGLPNETDSMILQTVDRVGKLGIDAVKIHPLYIVKNTALAKQNFTPISLEKYLDLLTAAIDILPKDIIYQRVSAGVNDASLLAPAWCRDKNALMSAVRKRLLTQKIIY